MSARIQAWWHEHHEVAIVTTVGIVICALLIWGFLSWYDAAKARTIAEMIACKDAHYEWVQISRDVFACYRGPQ